MLRKIKHIPIPIIIFFISLLLTTLSSIYVYESAKREDALELERAALITQQRINDRIFNYTSLLRAGAGMFASDENVNYQEFRDFVGRINLDKYYPGIQGIGFAPRVTPEQLP